MWNCTHFRHPTDEQLRRVDIYFLATKMICSLSTLNYNNVFCKQFDQNEHFSPFEFSLAGIKIGRSESIQAV